MTTLRSSLNGRLFLDQSDGGLPLVVGLHGWGRDRRDLAFTLAGRASLLPDLPGFGSSPAPSSAWGADDYADLVASALDEMQASGPIIVLGHSFGGRIAVCLAARRPDLVSGLVLTGVPLLRSRSGGRVALSYRLVRGAHRAGLITDGRMEAERQKRGSADYRAASGIMRDILVRVVNESYEDQIAAIQCPTGMVWGRNDKAAPLEQAEQAARLIGHLESLRILDGVGHDVHRDAPESINEMIDLIAATVTP